MVLDRIMQGPNNWEIWMQLPCCFEHIKGREREKKSLVLVLVIKYYIKAFS